MWLKFIIGLIFICGLSNRVSAQQFDFDKINSNSLLYILPQIQNTNDMQQFQGVNIMQIGSHNFSEIQVGRDAATSIIQNGSYNFLNVDQLSDKSPVKANISVNGNNNIIDIVGSNSISERLQINIQGDNKTVFMRNY